MAAPDGLCNAGSILEASASVGGRPGVLILIKKNAIQLDYSAPAPIQAAFFATGDAIMGEFLDEKRNEQGNDGGSPRPERRKQINLRAIFDDVVRLVEPFYQHGSGLNGRPTEFWASRAIHEAYSDLSSQEVQTLTAAAARYCRESGVGKPPA